MTETSKTVRFIAKLNVLTGQRKIEWRIVNLNPERFPEELPNDLAYMAEIEGQRLRLYAVKTKFWHDEDRWSWNESVRLEFVDGYGHVQHEISGMTGLYDLLSTVRVVTHKVDETMDKLLNIEE